MNKKKLIGQRIRERRKSLGWRLERLGKETEMNVSTLSKIETGDENYNASDDAIERIAKAMDTTLENLLFGSENFKVGVGACLWSGPLLYMRNDDKVPLKFSVAYEKKDGLPQWHDGSLKPEQGDKEIYTAPQLIEMLTNEDLDLVFIPRGTYDNESNRVFRIASIMNTVRGGLSILVVCKKDETLEEVVNNFKNQDKATNLYHSTSTIAEQIANNIFLERKDSLVELSTIGIENLNAFQQEFIGHVKADSNHGYHYIGYIGWEPHISFLRDKLQSAKKSIQIFEVSDIVDDNHPFDHIHFDCVANSNKVEFFKTNSDLVDFFSALDRAINELNRNKIFPKVHRSIQEIADNLSMNAADALKALRLINFELTFSKEWELYKSKS